jgi:hypothetical protein
MWALILMTLVFSGSAAGGVAVNTTFLDFPTEGKCRSAAAGMEISERVDIGGTRAGHPSISPLHWNSGFRAVGSVDKRAAAHLPTAWRSRS